MKPNIHPDYHDITVVMTDGTEFNTRSTYGKTGDKLRLDVDFNTHPAWNDGGTRLNAKATKVAKFSSRFGSIGTKKSSASEDAASNEDADSTKK